MHTVRTFEPPSDRRSLSGQEMVSVHFRSHNPHLRQCLATLRREVIEPEKWPLLAMVEEKIDCFQRYLKAHDKGGQVLFQDAAEWIFGDGDAWHFSFKNVCARLGLNPVSLREGLLEWKTKRVREVFPYQVFSLARAQRAQREPRARETKV